MAHGDTLLHPKHVDEEPFEAIVSKRWTKTLIRDNGVCKYALTA
ncbi:hypothetical protein [Trueperella pyogenes]|uniref:Uncharacterized protein n=1 Tax=Trueperella pyogenes TaxID=1661 RepID=A0ABV3NDZ1_9ACTO